jgi:hypothetical protein
MRGLLGCLGGSGEALDRYPWYRGRDVPLPRATFRPLVKALGARLALVQQRAPMVFEGLRAHVLDVAAFNDRVARLGNKAAVGLEAIGAVLRHFFEATAGAGCHVVVDRQGGRTRYARFLWRVLAPKGIVVLSEENRCSAYRVEGKAGQRLTVKFLTQGDGEALPVALASMTAKYVRELHMELLNAYFQDRVGPGLRPTAGYVKDARRFLADIEPCLTRAGFGPELLIRQR